MWGEIEMNAAYRQILDIAGLVLISIAFPLNVVLGVLDGTGRLGVNNSISNDQFNETLTNPAPWTFAIWGVIYSWQLAWIIYAWTFVCRPNVPKSIYTGVYYGAAIAILLQVVWLFVYGAPLPSPAAVLLISSGFSFYFTIGSEVVYLNKSTDMKPCELWLTRLLVINGLTLYATWITVGSLLGVNVALQYDRGVDPAIASYIVLIILTLIVLVYFILESTILDKYLRHVFVVYPTLIWGLIGILANNWKQDDPTGVNLFTLGLLIVTVTLAFVRVVLFVLFGFIRPLNHNNKIEQPQDEMVCAEKMTF